LRARSLAIAALVALALSAAASACGASGRSTVGSADPGPLLTYREEGGIGGPRPALAVSTGADAALRLGHCRATFKLGRPRWRHLRSALRRADLGSIAGSYPPAGGSADAITYVVRSGGQEVRVAPAPLPRNEAVLAQLEPLLEVIGRTVASGERRLPSDCASNRVPQGASGGGPG
jgi:hypothetical protein